jgi:hypothetical protein
MSGWSASVSALDLQPEKPAASAMQAKKDTKDNFIVDMVKELTWL